ncbi:hypothetical protein N7468_004689 [Penicillium chermesinum]|uniref:HNH nuclease domain-containing protein n=1 Tax=Penicillium chermesinum TaxID=63820 RepID=A0A9W9TST0_9EURO|nr:uncharacterized protein N7468_004689 [Penicillium chermesinum]KAJ5240070.1 hypothetical protein N7468_004689 [Penicillium chermesinum]
MSQSQSAQPGDGRNVHFLDVSTGNLLGGFYQNGSVTQSNFLDMLNIVLNVVPHGRSRLCLRSFTVKTKSGRTISKTSQVLRPGDYDIYAPDGCSIALTDEEPIRRIFSRSRSNREQSFRNGVRARDKKCVFTGVVNRRNFSQFITNTDSGNHAASINSVQNGLLLQSTVHTLFDTYSISVNPDDNYKITSFVVDDFHVDGRILDPVCRNPADPNHVSDDLLRWYFRQSVLVNMKGAGEPPFEHDFPPGSDMLGEILEGPFPIERFEMELSSRLRGWEQQQDFIQ